MRVTEWWTIFSVCDCRQLQSRIKKNRDLDLIFDDRGWQKMVANEKEEESRVYAYPRKNDLGQIGFRGFLSPLEDETSSQEVEDFQFRNIEMRARYPSPANR